MSKKILAVVSQLEELFEHLTSGKVAKTIPAEPSSVQLTSLEWDLWDRFAKTEEYKSAVISDPGVMLSILKKKSGYERLKSGMTVKVRFRRNGSDPLVAHFTDRYAKVVSADEYGNPWVQFNLQDWQKAVERSRNAANISPFETKEYDQILPEKRALRISPLDTVQYHKTLHAMGLPFNSVVQVTGQKVAYLYDPFIQNQLGVSKQQLLYVLRHQEELLPELMEDETDENVAPIGPNPVKANLRTASAPAINKPPRSIGEPDSKNYNQRIKVWRAIFKDPEKVKSLKKLAAKNPALVWRVAVAIYINKCIKEKVIPFPGWTKARMIEYVRARSAKAAQSAKIKLEKQIVRTPKK